MSNKKEQEEEKQHPDKLVSGDVVIDRMTAALAHEDAPDPAQPARDCKTFCRLFAEAQTRKAYYEETCRLNQCKYHEFYSSVSCLFVEGVEFLTREELYQAIKKRVGSYL